MKVEKSAFGTKSYQYAIGRVMATSHPVLKADQWRRLMESNEPTAIKLLDEYGYGNVQGTPEEKIHAELKRTIEFIKEIAPVDELVSLMFFEEDAHNLKLFLKAKLTGQKVENLVSDMGSFSSDIIRICVDTEDYSMLGKELETKLTGIEKETNPQVLSDKIDIAVFTYALSKAKSNKYVYKMIEQYGVGKNRIKAARIRDLGKDIISKESFLPVPWDEYIEKDKDKEKNQILQEVYFDYKSLLETFKIEANNMSPIVDYLFSKKIEAKNLRVLFAKKRIGQNMSEEDFIG